MIYLVNTFKDFKITQRFGWTPFAFDMKKRYEETGKKLYKYGIHTGIDFGIKLKEIKSPMLHGVILTDDDINDSGRGIALSIWDMKQNIAGRFYHLHHNNVKLNQDINALDIVGVSGRKAGKLTVGNSYHLHFELVRTDSNGNAIGEYNGAIDPFGLDVIWLNEEEMYV